jgi:TRAP-type C4-dicarboxylate transport system substrate-binding protein
VRRAFALLASMAAAVLLPVTAAPGQDKPVSLRFSHWVPAGHPMHSAAEAWAASIKRASGGTISITIYPAQQLGKAFDHYNMARDGIADIAHVNPGYEPGRFPIMGAAELPFNFANAKQGSGALDKWYRKYAEREMRDVKYCLTFAHDPATFHFTRRRGVVPADIAGLKVRPANAMIARWITLLGGNNVQASAPEVRDVLEKGVAEAVTFPWGSTVLFGIDKVTKYHIDSSFYVTEQSWVINKAKYDAMSPAQKKVMEDHCTSEWAAKIALPWADMEASGRDKIKAQAGQEVYPLTPEELGQWRKSAEPLRAEWAETVRKAGVDPDVVLGELRASLANYNAAY